MAGTRKPENVEISSDQLRSELIEIKERLGSLETISSLAHRPEIEALVRGVLKNDRKKKDILKECQQPQTREMLMTKFECNSPAALDYHLNPLRDSELLHQGFDVKGIQTFHWSKLFSNLPKAVREKLFT